MTQILAETQIQVGYFVQIYLKRVDNSGWNDFPSWAFQNFSEETLINHENNQSYYYFPFTITGISQSADLDGLNGEIKIANTSWARNKLEIDIPIQGAKVEIRLAFLQRDGGDSGTIDYYLNTPQIIRRGIVDSVIYQNAIITFRVQSLLSAVDNVIPAHTFSGEAFLHLPYISNSQSNDLI